MNNDEVTLVINIILVVVTILSLIMNSLVITVLIKKKKRESLLVIDKLILSIAIVDIIESLFCIGSSIYHSIYGDMLLYDKPWYCQLSSWLVTTLLLTSIMLLTLIAVYRYLQIKYKKIVQVSYIVCIMGLFIILMLSLGIFCFMTKAFKPVGTGAYCYPSFKYGLGGIFYYTFIAVSNILISILFSLCYFGIFLSYHHSTKKIIQSNNRSQSISKYSNNKNITKDLSYVNGKKLKSIDQISTNLTKKILFRVIIYIFLYLPCWIPNLIAITWDLAHLDQPYRPPILDSVAVIAVLLTILMNPIMVFLVHSCVLHSLLCLLGIKKEA